MRSRRALALAFALVVAATALSAASCSNSGNPKPGPTPTPTLPYSPTPTVTPPAGAVVEAEPNDVALGNPPTPLAASTQFFGVCADDSDFDYFRFTTTSAGTISADLTWTESPANDDLDLLVEGTSFQLVRHDDDVPPGDSPAQLSFTSSAGLAYFVEIDCYNTSPNVAYLGTLTIP